MPHGPQPLSQCLELDRLLRGVSDRPDLQPSTVEWALHPECNSCSGFNRQCEAIADQASSKCRHGTDMFDCELERQEKAFLITGQQAIDTDRGSVRENVTSTVCLQVQSVVHRSAAVT
eukprot:SAG31_NODE_16803_length_695_cov_0.944631_2_plen_118_part_00